MVYDRYQPRTEEIDFEDWKDLGPILKDRMGIKDQHDYRHDGYIDPISLEYGGFDVKTGLHTAWLLWPGTEEGYDSRSHPNFSDGPPGGSSPPTNRLPLNPE